MWVFQIPWNVPLVKLGDVQDTGYDDCTKIVILRIISDFDPLFQIVRNEKICSVQYVCEQHVKLKLRYAYSTWALIHDRMHT